MLGVETSLHGCITVGSARVRGVERTPGIDLDPPLCRHPCGRRGLPGSWRTQLAAWADTEHPLLGERPRGHGRRSISSVA